MMRRVIVLFTSAFVIACPLACSGQPGPSADPSGADSGVDANDEMSGAPDARDVVSTIDAHDSGFMCSGTYGTTKSADGDYFLTSFGCWLDANGAEHTDPGDNCVPTCLDKAIAAGLCDPGTGKACEEKVTWFTADGA